MKYHKFLELVIFFLSSDIYSWPKSTNEWECVTRSQVKPYIVSVLSKGACFGEQSVILNRPRHATAQAKSLYFFYFPFFLMYFSNVYFS